jgi:hypothetical protein
LKYQSLFGFLLKGQTGRDADFFLDKGILCDSFNCTLFQNPLSAALLIVTKFSEQAWGGFKFID